MSTRPGEPDDRAGPRAAARDAIAAAVMLAAVLLVYLPPSALAPGKTLLGADHLSLHRHRIAFARQALLADEPHLPGWYPRELCGTPFWSNVQSFPFIPTRLPLLLVAEDRAFLLGVNLSAALAALFAFLWARRIGLAPAAAAALGWTFACAGFFAARVRAGHLPLLEGYPALPLLLWLGERTIRDEARRGRRLLALGAAAAAVALAGHPQLPVYAVATTAVYLAVRAPRGLRARSVAALGLGGGVAAFALVPMALLVGRSTRVLPLDPAGNDLAFPFTRLLAFVLPWAQGWPETVPRAPARPFTGFASTAHFWDTVAYVGWLPLLALAALLVARRARAAVVQGPVRFALVAGGVGLLLALPPLQAALQLLPGTFLRSPARLVYLTTFALAVALGAALDRALRAGGTRGWPAAALAVLLAAHAVDLGRHARAFVAVGALPGDPGGRAREAIGALVTDGRVAIDPELPLPYNRTFDDVGFFDSLMLAGPYRTLLAASGAPPGRNVQELAGSELRRRALQAAGVRAVVTTRTRPDLQLLSSGPVRLYRVPDPTPRVRRFPAAAAAYVTDAELEARLRDQSFDLARTLLLPPEAAPLAPPAGETRTPLRHARPSSDEILVQVTGPGWLRILEAWDPGWRATVDGAPAPLVRAQGAFMALPLAPGEHEVRLRFRTPGAGTGLAVSLASLLGLALLCATSRGTRG